MFAPDFDANSASLSVRGRFPCAIRLTVTDECLGRVAEDFEDLRIVECDATRAPNATVITCVRRCQLIAIPNVLTYGWLKLDS
jgi:hypothetical protein